MQVDLLQPSLIRIFAGEQRCASVVTGSLRSGVDVLWGGCAGRIVAESQDESDGGRSFSERSAFVAVDVGSGGRKEVCFSLRFARFLYRNPVGDRIPAGR